MTAQVAESDTAHADADAGMTRRRVAAAAGLIAIGALGSRILGVIREPATAYFFGRSASTDSYFIATSLSTIVYDLLVSGMVGAALIPVLSRLGEAEDRTEFWEVVSTLAVAGAALLAAVVALLVVVAPQLVYMMNSGAGLATQAETVLLARTMMPAMFFMGMSALCTAVLYSLHRYRYGALSVMCVNAGVIGGLVLLHRFGIVSAAYGLVVGAILQFGVQIPGLKEAGAVVRPRLHLRHPEVIKIGVLYAPVGLSFLITGLIVIVDRNLYSHVGAGALSASQYATRLVQVPLGLVSTALSMAILPTLSRYAGLEDLAPFRRVVSSGIKLAALLMLPAMVGLMVLRTPVLALLFQRGQFSGSDTAVTALAFFVYAPQMPFVAIDQVIIFACYAMHDTKTPVVVMAITGALYFLVAFSLIAPLGMIALILANTVQNSAHALLLLWLLHRRIGGVITPDLGGTLASMLVASGAMAIVCVIIASSLNAIMGGTGMFGPLLTITLAGGAGLIAYAGVVWRADITEARVAWQLIVGRLRPGATRG